MTTILRDDGKQFITCAYRELLSRGKLDQLVQEIKLIAEQQGKYLHFSQPKEKDKSSIETVFSKEPGYLLGESVSDHFNNPNNLLFCEALPNEDSCLIVIIRDGVIYLDSKIPTAQLNHELIPLITGSYHYHIHLYGNVAISDQPNPNSFYFPKKHIASFNQQSESLLKNLKVSNTFYLNPLKDALKSPLLPHKSWQKFILPASVLATALLGWMFFHNPTVRQHTAMPAETISSFSSYNQALHSPRPSELLDNLINKLNVSYLAPGWTISAITLDAKNTQLLLMNSGGTLAQLNHWANKNDFSTQMQGNSVLISAKTTAENRPKPEYIYPAKQVLSFLIDSLSNSLQTKNIEVIQTIYYKNTQKTQLALNLDNVSPQTLSLIANETVNLPITLSDTQLSVSDGLISGTINLSVWGN